MRSWCGIDNYKKVMDAIDNLEGIKMTKDEQVKRLQEQSEQMGELRDRIRRRAKSQGQVETGRRAARKELTDEISFARRCGK